MGVPCKHEPPSTPATSPHPPTATHLQDFDPFAVLVLTLSVIHANFVTNGARSHWLMGVQLVATYLLIAITFLYR